MATLKSPDWYRTFFKPLYSGEGVALQRPTMESKPPCITCLMDPICEDWTDKDWLEFPERLSIRALDALSCAEIEMTMVLSRVSCPITRGNGMEKDAGHGWSKEAGGPGDKGAKAGGSNANK